MYPYQDSQILAAAEAILDQLVRLVGARDAARIGSALRGLLDRAGAGEATADQIIVLLRANEATRRWLVERLGSPMGGPVHAKEIEADNFMRDPGDTVKYWRDRPGERDFLVGNEDDADGSGAVRVDMDVARIGGDIEGVKLAELEGGAGEKARSPKPGARPRRPARIVSTGFSLPGTGGHRLAKDEPLERASGYDFWLQVGAPAARSIEERPRELLPEESLEAGSTFDVVVQPFPGELEIDPQARSGQLVMDGAGRFAVARQPGAAQAPGSGGMARETALRFPVRTTSKPGPQRLRCGIYFRNTLVQSRIVTAWVGKRPVKGPALSAEVDVSLARMFDASELAPVRPHALSVLVNANGDASHSFRFVTATDVAGAAAIANDAVMLETDLGDLIRLTRGSMRKVAWGSKEPWTTAADYRYASAPLPDLATDLFELARAGRHVYDALINAVAEGADAAAILRTRMLSPGRVQFVSRGRPNELIPASMFYDYQNAVTEAPGLTLCPQFVADRAGPDPLEKSACFRGACPSMHTPQVVCPSGFWGYRHAIGMPVVVRYVPPPPAELKYTGKLSLGVAAFVGFDLWPAHRQRLEHLDKPWAVSVADTYEKTIGLLSSHKDSVIYFYCHGGATDDNVPYLLVGPEGATPLVRSALRLDTADRYATPRSLVILNGCQTTALEPDRAIEFVTAFVENVGAAGVIGTEITVFEELATAFGESLLGQLGTGIEIGEAVRRSRLALLKAGNPLGLVYVPMVQADARLVAQG